MNKEIMSVPASTEVFVDYCHLTPEGNKIIAEIISKNIKNILNTQKKAISQN